MASMSIDHHIADDSVLRSEQQAVSAQWPMANWHSVAPVAAILDVAVIVGVASLSSLAYNLFAFGNPIRQGSDVHFSLEIALFYLFARILRGDYSYGTYITPHLPFGRIASAWLLAFLALLSTVFLLKVGSHYSRGTALSLFVIGPIVLAFQQRLLSEWLMAASRKGKLAARRVFVIGEAADIEDYRQASDVGRTGRAVVDTFVLGDGTDPALEAAQLAAAVARARQCDPNDVLITLPIGQTARIQAVVDAFKVLPASVQLGADLLLKRYPALRTLRNGDSASLELVRQPLTTFERLAKRGFDIVVASIALVLLSPVLAAVAFAIKWTSPGPVLFRQDRHAYNREKFRIFKFRTMQDGSDQGAFKQTVRNDPRVTPVGAFLRRTSIDELPQLLNVLIGDMSIVGPRPHAIAHDNIFEHRIDLYARRHNIKPGITGWAQVNGFRGETDTEEKMRGRIEHDLAYLDHWSLMLDIKIIIMTAMSLKAHTNAH
jgi:Undecaprenyl-phosphate glucose phosphotransferase